MDSSSSSSSLVPSIVVSAVPLKTSSPASEVSPQNTCSPATMSQVDSEPIYAAKTMQHYLEVPKISQSNGKSQFKVPTKVLQQGSSAGTKHLTQLLLDKNTPETNTSETEAMDWNNFAMVSTQKSMPSSVGPVSSSVSFPVDGGQPKAASSHPLSSSANADNQSIDVESRDVFEPVDEVGGGAIRNVQPPAYSVSQQQETVQYCQQLGGQGVQHGSNQNQQYGGQENCEYTQQFLD